VHTRAYVRLFRAVYTGCRRAFVSRRETGEVCGDLIAKSFGATKNTMDLAKLIIAFMESPNLELFVDADAAHEITTAIAEYERKAAKAATKK